MRTKKDQKAKNQSQAPERGMTFHHTSKLDTGHPGSRSQDVPSTMIEKFPVAWYIEIWTSLEWAD